MPTNEKIIDITADEQPAAEVILNLDSRLAEAKAIVQGNVMWASGIGLVPVPIVDLVGITGVQVRMLKKLSELYGIPFMEHRVKNILASLLVGAVGVKTGTLLAAGLVKSIPIVGQTLGLITVPVLAGALTHATGHVFIGHFESGGNFLDFEPQKAREHFAMEFKKARETLNDEIAKKA